MTATLAYGALPQGCGRNVTIGGARSYLESTTFDPPTGLTTLVLDIPAAPGRIAGPADLVVTNSCSTPGDQEYVTATATAAGAVAYSAGYHVTSADIPATVTSGTVIVIHGPDVGAYADVAYWMTDSHGVNEPVNWWDFTSNGSTTTYVDYPGDDGTGNEAWYQGSGPLTFHVGYCPIGYRGSREQRLQLYVGFLPGDQLGGADPGQPVLLPSSGPVAGGTVITVRGRFIVSGTDNLVVKVGDQTVTDPTVVSEADGEEHPVRHLHPGPGRHLVPRSGQRRDPPGADHGDQRHRHHDGGRHLHLLGPAHHHVDRPGDGCEQRRLGHHRAGHGLRHVRPPDGHHYGC